MQAVFETEICNEDKKDKGTITIADKYCRQMLKLLVDRSNLPWRYHVKQKSQLVLYIINCNTLMI